MTPSSFVCANCQHTGFTKVIADETIMMHLGQMRLVPGSITKLEMFCGNCNYKTCLNFSIPEEPKPKRSKPKKKRKAAK